MRKMKSEELKYNNKNHEEKLRRLNEWSRGNPQPPFKFSIIPTNRCNLKCDACPNSVARGEGRFSKEDEISKKMWMKIIERGLKWGVKEWRILGGGEPMVRRKTTLAILYRTNRESVYQDTEMITNGTLFKARDIEKLVKLRMNRILFSIDGPDAKTHDTIRGVSGAFKETFGALRHFHKTKKRTNIDKPFIQVNSVLNNINYDKINEMLELFNQYGVDEWALHPMREYEEIKDQMQYLKLNDSEKDKLKQQIKIAEDRSKEIQLKLNLDMIIESGYLEDRKYTNEDGHESNENNYNNKFINSKCFEPFYGLLITPKGLVSQCVPYGQGVRKLDLRKKSLEDIWYGKYFQKIRKRMLNHSLTESCKKCGLLDMTEELRNELKKYRK
ncbi:MAG: radical SAM/SPASM domain-containing protein [Candidatus Aenigmatarchaeota archaeon]